MTRPPTLPRARPPAPPLRPGGRLVSLAAALGLLLAATGCEDRLDPVGPAQTWTAVYSLELTGSGTVVSIAYDDGAGNELAATAAGPSWTRTVLLRPGSSVAARAQVGLLDGSVVLKLAARDGSGHTVDRTQSCAGSQKSCSLEIPRETLP